MKMYGEKDVVERREYVKMHRVRTLCELQNNTMEPLGWFSLPGWFKDLVRSELSGMAKAGNTGAISGLDYIAKMESRKADRTGWKCGTVSFSSRSRKAPIFTDYLRERRISFSVHRCSGKVVFRLTFHPCELAGIKSQLDRIAMT